MLKQLKLLNQIKLAAVILSIALVCMLTIWNSSIEAKAEETYGEAVKINVTISLPQGKSQSSVTDNSYSTKATIFAGSQITIASTDNMYGIYIKWAKVPATWQISYNGTSKECGTNGFLHEYVSIPEGTTSVTITSTDENSVCEISAYSQGELPSDVQVWEPECEQADMLVLSTHADDEVLFLGGVLVEYAGEEELSVQVVYFSNYFNGTVIREHEKLDGLWVMGVRNYPVNADFDDIYAADLSAAEKTFGYDKTLEFIVEQIRKFKPLVCVAQDTNGEYGHGTHMLTSKAMQEAVTISMDESKYSQSAQQYGTYDVPKTYIHLYGDNKLILDCQKSLSKFGGRNAVDVASEAYKQHVSQQWCWFYVSDTYEYSCADFGLYRTTVGNDTGNNMFENIETYKAKAIRLEQERIEQQKKAEEESIVAEQQSIEDEQTVTNKINNAVNDKYVYMAVGVFIVVILVVIIVLVYTKRNKRNKHKK